MVGAVGSWWKLDESFGFGGSIRLGQTKWGEGLVGRGTL